MTPELPRDLPASRIVLGSRKSDLARAQARRVASDLRGAWPGLEVETVWITTTGDRVLDRPLPEIGGKGVFTAELEAALLDGEIDAAVHSLKDLPTDLGDSFEVLGVPGREDPRDVLLGPDGTMGLEELDEEAVVGTSSLRRRAQLLARRPDCRVRDLRGNVETRVEKMRRGDYDAVILAAAGLLRLELVDAGEAVYLETPEWLPAPAQGALGVEGRAGDETTRALVERLEDPDVRSAVDAERSFLATLRGGCLVPVGARGRVAEGRVRLDAVVLTTDGRTELRASGESGRGSSRALGRRLAENLLARGADRILADVEAAAEQDPGAEREGGGGSAAGDDRGGGRGAASGVGEDGDHDGQGAGAGGEGPA